MVEVSRSQGKAIHCDYTFESLNVQGSNYRVPKLNRANTGKVLEKGYTNEENKRQPNNAKGG